MTAQLLGPNGRPISSASYKKDKPKAFGPAFGQWQDRDVAWNEMPGGAILQFDLSALTLADYRAMRYHPQINANLSVLTFMLHQLDWKIECPEDKKFAQEVDDELRPMWTRLVRALSQSFWAGFSPIAIEMENDVQNRRVVWDKFKDLRPEECTVNWKKVDGSYIPPGASIAPKFSIYDGIKQFGQQAPIPAENTLWYPLLMENGDMYGRKLLKAAFAPWYFSTLIHLFANRYFERFGEPMPIGRAPFDQDFPVSSDSNETISAKTAMEQVLMNLRNRASVVLPNDIQMGSRIAGDKTAFEYSIEYLESQMRGADFERYLQRLDEEITLALFTPLLLLRTADVGSNNLGVQHTQTWLWCLNALAGDMAEYIDRYVIARYKAYNHQAGPRGPRVRWVPRKMGKESVETLRAIITALLSADKIKLDVDELGVALGMTVTEVKQVTRDDPEGEGDPEGDDPDNRVRVRPGEPRKGVGEPRATGREVTARIKQQVEKAWKENRFGTGFVPNLGYRKRFIKSLVAEGRSEEEAAKMTNDLYGRVERWMEDAIGLGAEEYSSSADFMAMFERNLDSEIDRLAA